MPIELHPYQPEDIDLLYEVITGSMDHLKPWMPWIHDNYSKEDTRIWVNACINAWSSRSALRFLIRKSSSPKTSSTAAIMSSANILGSVGIESIDWSARAAALGYWVSAEAQCQGVATTAATLAAQQAFQVYGLTRLVIHILPNNLASHRVAEKMGASFEGMNSHHIYFRGEQLSAHTYSLSPTAILY